MMPCMGAYNHEKGSAHQPKNLKLTMITLLLAMFLLCVSSTMVLSVIVINIRHKQRVSLSDRIIARHRRLVTTALTHNIRVTVLEIVKNASDDQVVQSQPMQTQAVQSQPMQTQEDHRTIEECHPFVTYADNNDTNFTNAIESHFGKGTVTRRVSADTKYFVWLCHNSTHYKYALNRRAKSQDLKIYHVSMLTRDFPAIWHAYMLSCSAQGLVPSDVYAPAPPDVPDAIQCSTRGVVWLRLI